MTAPEGSVTTPKTVPVVIPWQTENAVALQASNPKNKFLANCNMSTSVKFAVTFVFIVLIVALLLQVPDRYGSGDQ
jgi:hypothetical protein